MPLRGFIPARWPAPWRWIALALLATIVAGCASRTRAPVEERAATPPWTALDAAAPAPSATAASATSFAGEADWRPATYTVKRGDTLYQVALDHGLDYRELAAWNDLENINLIRVGQVLRLTTPGDAATTSNTSAVVTTPLKPTSVVAESRAPTSTAPPAAAVARNSDNFKSSPITFN